MKERVLNGNCKVESCAEANKYLYNGKELTSNYDFGESEITLGWYDFNFRYYDPALGRFPSIDPIIEQFPYLTPFNYASNNPVTNIDLWGLQGVPAKPTNNGMMTTAQSSTYVQAPKMPVTTNTVSPLLQGNNATISRAPSNLEKWSNLMVSPDIKQYIEIDPVVKSVAVGVPATAVIVTAVETAPILIEGAETAAILMNNTTAGQIITGSAVGLILGSESPHDLELLTPLQTITMNLVGVVNEILETDLVTRMQQQQQQQQQTIDPKDKVEEDPLFE